MAATTVNLFRVLGLNYEIFHTRMLCWLWTPNADHGAGGRFLVAFMNAIGLPTHDDVDISAEYKIDVPGSNRWRLADILIRTPSHLVLVENKVDKNYQDVTQVREEIAGGIAVATNEGRQFRLVLLAPGPISSKIDAEVKTAGIFVSWNNMVEVIRSVDTRDLDPFIRSVIEHYADFVRRPFSSKTVRQATDHVVSECEQGLRQLVAELPPGTAASAVELWTAFRERYPDHLAALEERYAASSNYSAKTWFSAKLQRMTANGDLVEDTGEWRKTDAAWGHPQVRVYRRLA
jgi:hypothetical protein